MATLMVFNQISLDGFFTDAHNDLSWAHRSDPEWSAFTRQNASGGSGVLLFGRVTYEMMVAFWPTPQAREMEPEVAEAMMRFRKVVFSRTLQDVSWTNTMLVKEDPVAAVRDLKARSPEDLVIMGSGTIVALLAQADLIDKYQFVFVPIVLGAGRTLFEGVTRRPVLRPTDTRRFSNGNVVIWYDRLAA